MHYPRRTLSMLYLINCLLGTYIIHWINISLLRFRLIQATNNMVGISNTLKQQKFKCQQMMKCDNLKVTVVVHGGGTEDALLLMQIYCSYWRVSIFLIFSPFHERNLRPKQAVPTFNVSSLSVKYSVQQIHIHNILQVLKIGLIDKQGHKYIYI